MTPEPTLRETPAATNAGLPNATVHVKLVIAASVQTTVNYSDGVKTRTTEVSGNGAVEFDAPTPWIAAGTATTALSAAITCQLFVDGQLVDSSDITQSGSMFAACAATQDSVTDTKEAGGTRVQLNATAESRFWYGWSADGKAEGDTNDAGTVTAEQYLTGETVRMIVVATTKSRSPAICTIKVGGAIADSQGAAHRGDIATCTATIK
jgi:hypothetical protein